MRKAAASGKQDIRTTLVTCFMIFGFEAFHGNIALAVAQVHTGIALMQEWKQNYFCNKSPYRAPDDEVIETFLSLEVQIMTFLDERPYKSHVVLRQEYAEKIRNMPSCFASLWQASKYFYMVKKHIEHFLHVSRRFLRLHFGVGDANETGAVEMECQQIKFYQAHHQAELGKWCAAFEETLKDSKSENDPEGIVRIIYLKINSKAANIALQTALIADEIVYDDYTAEFSDIVSLSKELIERLESRSKKTKWIFDISTLLPLYLVSIKCRVCKIRHKALDLLYGSQRREGIWDNILVWRMAYWIQGIEEKMIEGKFVPSWARVEDIKYSFNLSNRSVEIKCLQRSAEGQPLQEKKTNIVW